MLFTFFLIFIFLPTIFKNRFLMWWSWHDGGDGTVCASSVFLTYHGCDCEDIISTTSYSTVSEPNSIYSGRLEKRLHFTASWMKMLQLAMNLESMIPNQKWQSLVLLLTYPIQFPMLWLFSVVVKYNNIKFHYQLKQFLNCSGSSKSPSHDISAVHDS